MKVQSVGKIFLNNEFDAQQDQIQDFDCKNPSAPPLLERKFSKGIRINPSAREKSLTTRQISAKNEANDIENISVDNKNDSPRKKPSKFSSRDKANAFLRYLQFTKDGQFTKKVKSIFIKDPSKNPSTNFTKDPSNNSTKNSINQANVDEITLNLEASIFKLDESILKLDESNLHTIQANFDESSLNEIPSNFHSDNYNVKRDTPGKPPRKDPSNFSSKSPKQPCKRNKIKQEKVTKQNNNGSSRTFSEPPKNRVEFMKDSKCLSNSDSSMFDKALRELKESLFYDNDHDNKIDNDKNEFDSNEIDDDNNKFDDDNNDFAFDNNDDDNVGKKSCDDDDDGEHKFCNDGIYGNKKEADRIFFKENKLLFNGKLFDNDGDSETMASQKNRTTIVAKLTAPPMDDNAGNLFNDEYFDKMLLNFQHKIEQVLLEDYENEILSASRLSGTVGSFLDGDKEQSSHDDQIFDDEHDIYDNDMTAPP